MGTIKDITDLVMKLSNNIQDRKIATELLNIISIANQIQSDIFELQKENLDLKKDNYELTAKLNSKNQKTIFHANLLWLLDDKNPYCPCCFDDHNKLIHLHTSYDNNNFYCPICKKVTPIAKHPSL